MRAPSKSQEDGPLGLSLTAGWQTQPGGPILPSFLLFSHLIEFDSLCNPMDCSMPGFRVHHQFLEFAQTHVHRVSDAIQLLILCRPLLLLPSIFASIRVFSNESALCGRWPKYWSFSFNTGTSNEYSGLISSRIDWFNFLAVQGTLKSLLQHHSLNASSLLYGPSLTFVHDY